MKSMTLTMAGFGLLMAAMNVSGAMVEGSQPKEWQANAARHTITITRSAASDIEKKMIGIAEAAAPDGTNTWCDGEQNSIKVPFALTRDALAYYEALIQGYQKKTWKTYLEPSSQMTYQATPTHQDTYVIAGKTARDVYVVKLKLMFSANFTEEATQGVHFTKERSVVVDSKGTVLAVEGDGKSEVPVFAI